MIDAIVAALEEKHTGGAQFFDALDAALQTPEIYNALYELPKDPHRYTFVLTGKFGQEFLMWMNRCSKPYSGYILYPGGLRDGKARPFQFHYFKDPNRWMVKACFVDDSFYSGSTRHSCIQQLAVPKTIETYVAYDGSPVHNVWCHSLYRYHPVNASEA